MIYFKDENELYSYLINRFKKEKFIDANNRVIEIDINGEHFHFDFLELLPLSNKSNTVFSPYNIVFGLNKSLNRVKGGHKEWDERLVLSTFIKNVSNITAVNVFKYETPDFILNGFLGVEILSYKSNNLAIFNKFLRYRKNRKLSLKEMKKILGAKDFKKIFEQMNPLLDEDGDTILAYGVPGINSYNINVMREYLFEKIMGKKLEKYNSGYYQCFVSNYLVIKLEFNTDLHIRNQFDIIKKINIKYPNIKANYDLKIVVIDTFNFTIINLSKNVVLRNDLNM